MVCDVNTKYACMQPWSVTISKLFTRSRHGFWGVSRGSRVSKCCNEWPNDRNARTLLQLQVFPAIRARSWIVEPLGKACSTSYGWLAAWWDNHLGCSSHDIPTYYTSKQVLPGSNKHLSLVLHPTVKLFYFLDHWCHQYYNFLCFSEQILEFACQTITILCRSGDRVWHLWTILARLLSFWHQRWRKIKIRASSQLYLL